MMFCYLSSPPSGHPLRKYVQEVINNLEKREEISVYENGHILSKLKYFYPSPRNTDLRSPYPIDLEKTNKSRKAPSYNSK